MAVSAFRQHSGISKLKGVARPLASTCRITIVRQASCHGHHPLNQASPAKHVAAGSGTGAGLGADTPRLKDFSFIELNDGSSLRNLQIIAQDTFAELSRGATPHYRASIRIEGALVALQGKGQSWEIVAEQIEIIGESSDTYPLQKKGTRPSSCARSLIFVHAPTFSAASFACAAGSFAIHEFFQERGFVYVHTPIITGSDREGAGELFRVTTLDGKNPPRLPDGEIDQAKDFFGRSTYLTVSGQLEAEAFACALFQSLHFRPRHFARRTPTLRDMPTNFG